MKVNIPIEVTDETRSRVAAYFGRGGLCTRNEYRLWLNKQISRGLEELPEAKRRKPKPGTAAALEEHEAKDRSKHGRAAAAANDAICAKCGAAKDQHGRMGFTCPPNKATRPGSTFEAAK